MKVGTPIIVIAEWSSLLGETGHVTQTTPCLMVVVGDDPRPVRVAEHEIAPYEEPQHHGGAE